MRPMFITAERIFEKRAYYWAEHYQKRQQAAAFAADIRERALKACRQMPDPRLDLDGSLDTWNYRAAQVKPVEETIQLCREVWAQEPGTIFYLLVKWYWSHDEWDNFTTQFNNLPEPEPLYELVYDEIPTYKVVPYILGTTRGQSLYNSRKAYSVHRKTG